jgi:chromate reductase
VLGYVHADIVQAACSRIPLTRDMVGSDGTVTDPVAREAIAVALEVLAS